MINVPIPGGIYSIALWLLEQEEWPRAIYASTHTASALGHMLWSARDTATPQGIRIRPGELLGIRLIIDESIPVNTVSLEMPS